MGISIGMSWEYHGNYPHGNIMGITVMIYKFILIRFITRDATAGDCRCNFRVAAWMLLKLSTGIGFKYNLIYNIQSKIIITAI